MLARLLRGALCALLVVLGSCGGGGADPIADRLAAASSAPPVTVGAPAMLAPMRQAAPTSAVAAVDATALMDWAELTFPQFFPSFETDRKLGGYTYRYYAQTDAYVGVLGDAVYVMGSAFGNQLLLVGTLAQFACNVFPEACTTANAGANQNVTVGSTVVLDGTGSATPSARGLAYTWTIDSKPAGSSAVLAGAATSRPTFRADVIGQYVFRLVVSDESGSSVPTTVMVTASTGNVAPVARAGSSQSVTVGGLVFLDGSTSSDANGDALTYAWSFASRPSGSTATLSGPTSAAASFRADVAGNYSVALVVSDGKLSSVAATVLITSNTSMPIVSSGTGSSFCCKTCTAGRACGDSCISRTSSCTKVGGCAC